MRKKIDLTKKVTVKETVTRRTHITTRPINYGVIKYTVIEGVEEADDELDTSEEEENDDLSDNVSNDSEDNENDDDSLDDLSDDIKETKKQKKNQSSDGQSNPTDNGSNINNGNPSPSNTAPGNTASGGSAAGGNAASGGTAAGGTAAGGAAAGGTAAGGAAAGGAAAGGAAAGGAAAGGAAAGGAAVIGYIALAILIIGLIVMAIVIAVSIFQYNNPQIAFGGVYNGQCEEITVIFTDKKQGYKVTGTGTYPLEEYVAGVIYGELSYLAKNKELAKTYALAARTFGLKHVDDTCTIESSDRRQVFHDITEIDNDISRSAREAAEESAGQVLISNGELYPVQYDAFCSIAKDDYYYTIKQKEQKIPIEWAESQGMPSEWLECTCKGNHGRGMSTFGAYYLASKYSYTYDELISYYYGEEVTISTTSFNGGIEGITSIAGLEIKDTTQAKPLQQPIEEFLNSKGSSLSNMNSFIHNSVVDQGVGTRAGVVTAAVSTINYLYDNFNVKLPYYWGGKTSSVGIPSSFGKYSPSETSRGGNINYYRSFDCSGFVSWSIRNGGYTFSEQSTSGFDSNYSKNSCNIMETSCVGQPGDLINSRAGHVELIIAVDQENGKYFVAHSGGPGVVMQERDMHKGNSSNPTKIIFMEEFYSNQSNVNPSY